MPPLRLLNAVLILLCLACSAYGGPEPIVTSDLLRIRSVASIDVSKDGQRAVFAVRSIGTIQQQENGGTSPENHTDPVFKNQSHLYLLELADGQINVKQLTFGERSDSMPRLSPDGKRIVFVRDSAIKPAPAQPKPSREVESTAQVWIMPADGGEARQVTNFKTGCNNPRWSPDGRRIMVTSTVKIDDLEGVPPWPMERPKRAWKDAPPKDPVKPRPDGTREQIRAWLDRNSTQLNPNLVTRLDYQDELHLRGVWRFTHLYLIDPDPPVAPGTVAAPVDQDVARRITSGFFDHSEAVFMPDGQSVLYVAKKPSEQHYDRVLPTQIWRINIDGSNDRMILAMDGWSFSAPKPSRDGSVIAFTGQRMDEPTFRQTQLGMASLGETGASDPVWLTEESSFPASVNSYEWLHGQPALVFNAAMRGGFPLMTVSPGLIEPARLVDEVDRRPAGVQAFGVGGSTIVYSLVSANNPCVLNVRDARGDRLAYDFNPWVNDKTLSLPTSATITRTDGTKVQYWLMEPTNREPGKKYPLITNMHGGPAAMWGPGEFTMWHEFQLMCSWGFGVAYCNPRGSGGYGYEFQKKNFQDWGEGPGGDVLAVVDEVILKDWVDRERLLLTGGSYAGYLTAWIIGHDHRFKAAVAQRGVYDFTTFFGEGNAWRLVAWALGSPPPPVDARLKQVFDRNNALNFVTRIRTPLLIEHGSSDLRTGVSQSEMLYRALKELNKPVEYVRYPDAGHDMSRTGDPLQRMDRLNRIIEFFERHVSNDRPAPVASGGAAN